MRVKNCYAPGCPSNSEKEPNLSFHSLPSNETVLFKWITNMCLEEKIRQAPKSTQKHYFVCGKHFTDSCFQTYERKKLNRGAVPTIFSTLQIKKNTVIPSKPIILNHRIVFPKVFENIPQLSQVPIGVDLPVETPDLSTNEVQIFGDEIPSDVKSNPKSPDVRNEDLPVNRKETVEQLLINMFQDSGEIPKKSSIKFKKTREQFNQVKPSKKINKYYLKQVNKIILTLEKCNGNCMNLFNKHETIFNSKIVQNLEKLERMPASIKMYMHQKIKKINKKKSIKYRKHQMSFYAALYTRHKTAYKFLSNIFHLPPIRKLNIFLKNTKIESGINTFLFNQLIRNTKFRISSDKYCILSLKQIPLRPFLNYNHESDTIEGLHERTSNIVNQCFIFYLSGLNKTWKQPIAYYLVSNHIKSLHSCITEIISEIHEKTDLVVVASVSSMNSYYVNAIEHLMDSNSTEYVYNINEHEIIHIFDPPSLVKKLRDHFINHDIVYDGTRVAKWRMLEELVDLDGIDGGKKLTKLTREHIRPSKNQMKKTILAAQVFSSTVSSCLRIITRLEQNDTADFCLFVDKLFDSFNGTLIPKCKTNKLSGRFNDSSSHLEFWNEAQATLISLQFVHNKSGKIYTSFVAQAFISNINNLKKMWTRLKTKGFKYIIPKHLNLDPLENFHSVLKYFYGTDPTFLQFQESFKVSLINKSFWNPESTSEDSLVESQFFYALPHSSSNSYLFRSMRNVHSYSAENVAKFIAHRFLNYKCDFCVRTFCKNNVRMVPDDAFIQQIVLLQREVYKSITEFLNEEGFINKLYCFAEQHWSFDFNCSQHKYQMKFNTVMSICFIMVKCFIEITNKMLWKQSTKK